MLLLMGLVPLWLVACFFVTQRHSFAIATGLHDSLAAAVVAIPGKYLLAGLLAGLLYGLAFNVPYTQVDQLLAGNGPLIGVFAGQMLLWTSVGFLIAARLFVVSLFYRHGKKVEFSIFEQSRLEPFARVGMLDVAIAMGAMAIATLQSIDAHFRFGNYVSALLVAIPVATALLVTPMWTLHIRLKARKNELLADVMDQIAAAPEQGSAQEMAQLEILLRRRDRVRELHTWPLDFSIWSRLFFYGLIPPLAWLGAALVEVLVERMIGGG